MASMAPTVATATSAGASPKRGWVFGPVPDLILGCGLGYVAIAALVSLLPTDRGALLVWGGLASLFTGMPHYGATLLRVYEQREDRRRYAFFAVWATLAVWAVFAWGVYDVLVGSLLLTVYLTWSPWHYTGQNYGLAVMFLRRGGADLDGITKRVLYTSFLLSYAMVFLTLHYDPQINAYGPAVIGFTYQFMAIGLPLKVYAYAFLATGALYGLSLLALAWRLQGVGRAALVPTAALVVTQALWFSIPTSFVWYTGYTLSGYHVAFLFIWVAVGHAVQYLWITTYYAAGSKSRSAKLGYLVKTFLAGALVWTLPALVFAPNLLGTSSYNLGLFMLVASAVNLQHFILDGAIWKLRSGPVARILLAPPEPERPEPIEARRSRRGQALFLAVGGACAAIAVAAAFLYQIGWRDAVVAGDTARAERFEDWLRWLGRDEPAFWNRRADERFRRAHHAVAEVMYHKSLDLYPTPEAWMGIAKLRLARGEPDAAIEAFHESIAVHPTSRAWSEIAVVEGERGELDAAAADFDKALAVDPRDVTTLHRYGRFSLLRGDRDKAVEMLKRAATLAPDDEAILRDLERALR